MVFILQRFFHRLQSSEKTQISIWSRFFFCT